MHAPPDVPLVQVHPDEIVPMPQDLPAMVGFAADATFHGPDADRWRALPPKHLEHTTRSLWACSQVQAANLHRATAGWDKVLVVGWQDEPAMTAAVRACVERERSVTVLLGGADHEVDPALAQATKVVLAELVRKDQVATVICNPEPGEVLDVTLDAARSPDHIKVPRVRPVDVGPALDLPSTWCMPAPPVHFFRLVHVPMGHATRLPELAAYVAAFKAIRDLVEGPPVDMEGARFLSPQEVRARLPPEGVAAQVQARIVDSLGRVRFAGSRPLVDAIESSLRPVAAELEGVISALKDVERLRLQHLRAFTAAGIGFTVQALSSRLDSISDPYPQQRMEKLEGLLAGDGERGADDAVHITAWRHAFAGLSSQVALRGSPGWMTARSLVQERFNLFRSEYAAAVSRHLDVLVRRAQDPDAAPSTSELRALRDRGERIREDLVELQDRLWKRIMDECELAVREDRIVRWTASEAHDLAQLLLARISSLPVSGTLDRRATEILTRRPLGMADDRDFERYLQELRREAHSLVTSASDVPTYESVLLLLLQGRDPPVLRQALAASQGTEVELLLQRPVEPALMNWLTATGMLVVVAPRLKTCAIYWQRLDKVSLDDAELRRSAITEHRMADLSSPAPEGDSVETLSALTQGAVYLIVGLLLGVLRLRAKEGLAVHELRGKRVGVPRGTMLPYGGVHALASDPEVLTRLGLRIDEAIAALPLRRDGTEIVRKLIELAHLGPAPALTQQLGITGPRFENVDHPFGALVTRITEQAVAVMMDCLHTSEIDQLLRLPRRRRLVDVMQLVPSVNA